LAKSGQLFQDILGSGESIAFRKLIGNEKLLKFEQEIQEIEHERFF